MKEVNRINMENDKNKENKENEEKQGNQEMQTKVNYIDVLEYLLNESKKDKKDKGELNKEIFSSFDFYDLLFVLVLLESELIRLEEFIKYNAGLTSRVGYKIKFEDYTTDELMEILEGLVNKNNLTIEDDAKEEIRKIVYESSKIENWLFRLS